MKSFKVTQANNILGSERRMARRVNTERRGRVVNTPTWYSWGPGFESRPQLPAILIEVFHDFPQANSGIVP
jgi:hypothetical protein